MMKEDQKYILKPSRLRGSIQISGAKNSALRLLAASILTDETILIENFPTSILDGQIHIEMLRKLGKTCKVSENLVTISEENGVNSELKWNDRSIRNTLLILGSLLARNGMGKVPLPGGCLIGNRKYDLHENIFNSMGAQVWLENDHLCAESKTRLHGAEIHLPIRSTGATENAILCGTLAKGTTRIWNPHIRPEIIDLIRFLNNMGAKITVFGQEHIEVNGVDNLSGTSHRVIPDNVEAITWIIAAIITNGEIEIKDVPFSHIEIPMIFLQDSYAQFYRHNKNLIVKGGRGFPFEISTGPYPGINSDMHPIFVCNGIHAKGMSRVIDSRFPDRHSYINELKKLGADIRVDGEIITIFGRGNQLTGTEVSATDIRGGAALALSGLTAEGSTILRNVIQIERGYNNFAIKLKSLEANIHFD